MTVTIEKTSKKYRGRKAETYEEIRIKQQRWDEENTAVERMLRDLKPSVVLDCPTGTGRYVKACADAGVKSYIGIDVSNEMLALAKKKKIKTAMKIYFAIGDARDLKLYNSDVTLCVRFLDLIDESAMRAVVNEMMRVTRKAVILTIRLGNKYIPKSNTAEHDRKKFVSLINKAGWHIAEEVPVFNAGWTIMRIEK